ncbi:MAG: hypothetical protein HY861_01570 [Chlamydiia bacterium]|nr:hypothetical protein [Chlamydiia bacterium]
MVSDINSLSASSSAIAAQISAEVQEIDELIDALKKGDANTTTKKLSDLLIEYILAKMSGNLKEAQDIQSQISSLITTYGNDIKNADALEAKLQSIENTPSDQTASELEYLQNLAATLKEDVATGNMSHLYTE